MNTFSFKLSIFAVLNIASVLLVLSWTDGVTREYWDTLDQWIFNATNSSLDNGAFTWLMAVLSIRIADLVPLIVILGFFYAKDVIFAKQDRIFGLVGFVLILLVMILVRELLDLYTEMVGLNRESPTTVVDSAIRLSSMYPEFHLKDISGDSFPGDHAAVLLIWLGYSLFFARNKWSVIIVFLVMLFSLPRLIAGAHWFSDIAVGGLSITLSTLAFGLYTPLLNKPQIALSKVANDILSVSFKK